MAWCRQATSYYLNQCWPRCMMPYGITRPQWVSGGFMSLWYQDIILGKWLNSLKPDGTIGHQHKNLWGNWGCLFIIIIFFFRNTHLLQLFVLNVITAEMRIPPTQTNLIVRTKVCHQRSTGRERKQRLLCHHMSSPPPVIHLDHYV